MTDVDTAPPTTAGTPGPAAQAGPVRLTGSSRTALVPAVRGHDQRRPVGRAPPVNREVSIPSAWDRLHEAGNFLNLELAAGLATEGSYASSLPFLDSDLYKWLEARRLDAGRPRARDRRGGSACRSC